MNILLETLNERERELDEREARIINNHRNIVCMLKVVKELLDEAIYGKKVA